MVTTKPKTAEDLWQLEPEPGVRYELIWGELRAMPAGGGRHGEIGSQAHWRLASYVFQQRLGECYTSETGFYLFRDPEDVVVMPDVAFVRMERLPPETEREGYMEVVPDLVIEVVSPSDRPGKIKEKVDLYRAAGVPLLWLVEPMRRGVSVYRPGQPEQFFGETETLSGEDVVQGFLLPIAALFS
jgi:Uma2 family endonuclease